MGVDVLVADERMYILGLQQGFPGKDIKKHFTALNINSRPLEGNSNQNTLRFVTSPAAGWRALVDFHIASTLGAKGQCLQSLTLKRVTPGSKPSWLKPEPQETPEPTGSADPGPDTIIMSVTLAQITLAVDRGTGVATLSSGAVAGINGGDSATLPTGAVAEDARTGAPRGKT